MLECLSSAQLPAEPANLCGRMRVLHGWVAEVAASELLTQLRTSQDDVFRPAGRQVEVQVVAVHSPDLGGLHSCLGLVLYVSYVFVCPETFVHVVFFRWLWQAEKHRR